MRSCRSVWPSWQAVLHKGQVIGDTTTEALEEQGLGLMQYVKQCYNYRSDRVGKALRELTGEEG